MLDDLLANDAPPPDRAPRQSVFLSAEISGFHAPEPSRHRVRDLSTTGARIDGAHNLRSGATVLVSVGALRAIGATIIWLTDGVAGLKFAETIDPEMARARTALPSRR